MGVDWDSWAELGQMGRIGTPFQVSGEIFCLSLGLSPFPLPVPIHPVCPNSPRLTVIHNNIPATGVDWDTGGESGRRAQAGRDILSLCLFRLDPRIPIHLLCPDSPRLMVHSSCSILYLLMLAE